MDYRIIILAIGTLFCLSSCNKPSVENSSHNQASDIHDHAADSHNHDHEEISISYTSYSENYELFAEADPFVKGQSAHILAHITSLRDFKPLQTGSVEAVLQLGSKKLNAHKKSAIKAGIYSFEFIPEFSGKAQLSFIVQSGPSNDTIFVSNQRVYKTADDAFHAEFNEDDHVNSTAFPKEQSWKVDFRTEQPKVSPFGKVIRAVGQVQGTQNDEIIISARTNGIVHFIHNNLIEGKLLSNGQSLFSISSKGFVDNNLATRLNEASLTLQKTKADFERHEQLFGDKIISEKEYLDSKNSYDQAQLNFDNLNRNYQAGGQKVKSPETAYIHQMFVQNGQYVEAGQKIMSLIKNKKMVIQADVDLKNALILPNICSVTVNNVYNDEIIEFNDLNHETLTIGQHTNSDNFMVPVTLQLQNKGNFVPGSFVELYLKTSLDNEAVTVPNTSLLEEQGKMFLYVQINPELFEKRYVNPGVTDGVRTEIKKGITPNERFVSEGAIFVKLSHLGEPLDAHAGHVH